jgi:sensor histidine kinase YesM
MDHRHGNRDGEERIEEILSRNDDLFQRNGKRIGVRNVVSRLRLFFNERGVSAAQQSRKGSLHLHFLPASRRARRCTAFS